jgi:hypothetical protein
MRAFGRALGATNEATRLDSFPLLSLNRPRNEAFYQSYCLHSATLPRVPRTYYCRALARFQVSFLAGPHGQVVYPKPFL